MGPLGGSVKRLAFAAALLMACLAAPFAGAGRAHADIFISVDKAAQRMTVAVDGRVQHVWPVSTGTQGGPPSGSFRPQRMHRKYFSRTYDW
jgi:hypothetical protein